MTDRRPAFHSQATRTSLCGSGMPLSAARRRSPRRKPPPRASRALPRHARAARRLRVRVQRHMPDGRPPGSDRMRRRAGNMRHTRSTGRPAGHRREVARVEGDQSALQVVCGLLECIDIAGLAGRPERVVDRLLDIATAGCLAEMVGELGQRYRRTGLQAVLRQVTRNSRLGNWPCDAHPSPRQLPRTRLRAHPASRGVRWRSWIILQPPR